jgi:predicted RNA-binding Zn ribbon-like protein
MTVINGELITSFVNTLHRHPGRPDEEALASPDGVGAWLQQQGLLDGEPVGRAAAERTRELREALRVLLLANNGVDVELAAAWAVLDRAARRGRVELRFREGPELAAAAAGVDGALGRIVSAVETAVATGAWERLKACRARDCEWAFEDGSKNQSKAWCSMRSCGNREKARSFRRRRVDPAEPAHEGGTGRRSAV